MSRMPNTRTLFLAFACLLAATAASAVLPARAQDVRTLSDRIERLQRDVDTLNRQVGGGRSAPFTVPNPPLSAQQGGGGFSSTFIDRTDQRFSELESQVRELRSEEHTSELQSH